MVKTLEENPESKKTLKTDRWAETTAQNTQRECLLKMKLEIFKAQRWLMAGVGIAKGK